MGIRAISPIKIGETNLGRTWAMTVGKGESWPSRVVNMTGMEALKAAKAAVLSCPVKIIDLGNVVIGSSNVFGELILEHAFAGGVPAQTPEQRVQSAFNEYIGEKKLIFSKLIPGRDFGGGTLPQTPEERVSELFDSFSKITPSKKFIMGSFLAVVTIIVLYSHFPEGYSEAPIYSKLLVPLNVLFSAKCFYLGLFETKRAAKDFHNKLSEVDRSVIASVLADKKKEQGAKVNKLLGTLLRMSGGQAEFVEKIMANMQNIKPEG